MSAVMLKTAIYGLLRVSFDLLHTQFWWWGGLLLALGLATALFGVVFAAVQVDMKRLLAYSSIENIGLMAAGIGLTLIFSAYGMKGLAALALTATLYHVASHAVFKSLLFLSTGCVLHATAERSLGKLGGLIRYMPWVAWVTLVGVLTSAGLPPLGGFVSEWLLLQSFLFTPSLPDPLLNMLIPLVAALIALVAALAGYTMVKFFGVIFLGQPREASLARAHDAGPLERIGLAWLALGCIGLGLLPTQVIRALANVTRQLVGVGLPNQSAAWWLLAPVPGRPVSYAPMIFFLVLLTVVLATLLGVRLFYHGRVRRSAAWDCGFARLDARMQDTAEGFGQPIRHIFGFFFDVQRELPTPFDRAPRYRVTIGDRIWRGLYEPIGALVQRIADAVAWLHQGRISTYLFYSFATLVALLALVL
jgi:NADH:ubiquinone oxidoreductase subunit 5 (subunit L)/multisubunit Na+/H+ antiporter MnhA subunit